MRLRRGAVPLMAVLVFASASSAQDRKMNDQQKKEIQNVVKIVDDVAAGQPAPNDLSAQWVREDFLKAQGNKEYVPFTVSIDASKLNGATTVAIYWRVVPKAEATAAAAAPAGQKKDDKDKD